MATRPPPRFPPANVSRNHVVYIGMLLPLFAPTDLPRYWSPRLGVYQALREINNKSDGVEDSLLPNAELRLVYADSRCDATRALGSALQMVEHDFAVEGYSDDLSVTAIIGAGCAAVSEILAQVGDAEGIPIISPATTSSALSDYPWFFRTVPSDVFASEAIMDVLLHLKVTWFALVHTTAPAAISYSNDLKAAAARAGVYLSTSVSFGVNAQDFTNEHRLLRSSGSRAIVLLSSPRDGARFMRAALAEGIGGEGFLWVTNERDLTRPHWWGEDVTERDLALRGSFAVVPSRREGTEKHAAYTARRRALPPLRAADGTCNNETESTGTFLWGGFRDDQFVCSDDDVEEEGPYDVFAYDAMYALAYGIHHVLEVRRETDEHGRLAGDDLRNALFQDIRFEGVTGPIKFVPPVPGAGEQSLVGDRTSGFQFEVLNFAATGGASWATVGTWAPCANCSFATRFQLLPDASLVFSTADNTPPGRSPVCATGEAITSSGECDCIDGYDRDVPSAPCKPCPAGQDSLAADSSGEYCPLCAPGYYRPTPFSPSSDCARCDGFRGVSCPANVTAGSVVMEKGYWRISGGTLRAEPCRWSGNWTPCLGGGTLGDKGNGYCADGHHGPRCELCDRQRYFNKQDAHCHACDGAATDAVWKVLLVCAVLVAVLAGAYRVIRRAVAADSVGQPSCTTPLDRAVRCVVESYLVRKLRTLGLQPKLKITIAFYQIVVAMETVCSVKFPNPFAALLRQLEAFSFDFSFFLPKECLSTSFAVRLVVTSFLPLGFIACVFLWFALRVTFVRGCQHHRGIASIFRNAAISTTTVALLIIFVCLPSLSSVIFQAWSCEPFPTSDNNYVYYLRSDLSVQCYESDEHEKLTYLGYFFVAIWPVGAVLLCAALLYTARKPILKRVPTRFVHAIAFLHRDYRPERFYWEVIELVRRTCLTGWLLLVDERNTFTRIAIAILICLASLVLTLYATPYRRSEDQALAVCSQLMLLVSFMGGSYIRLYDDLELQAEFILPGITARMFGFGSSNYIVNLLLGFTVAMVIFLVCTLSYIIAQDGRDHLIRIRSSNKKPELVLYKGERFHLFNSHVWSTAQDAVATIKRQLQRFLPGIRIFLDVDDLESIADLETYVHESSVVLMFLSQGYFSSRNCMREVMAVLKLKKPYLFVQEPDPSKGGAPLEVLCNELPREDYRKKLFDGRRITPWYRMMEFQLISLAQICEDFLQHTPKYKGLGIQPLYIPGSLAEQTLMFPRPVRVGVSDKNPGAMETIQDVQGSFPEVEPTGAPSPTHLLLYLNQDTFRGEHADELAEGLRVARAAGLTVAMIHELDPHRGGCPFDSIIRSSPDDLVDSGLYRDLAIPFPESDRHRKLAHMFFAKQIGAKGKAFTLKLAPFPDKLHRAFTALDSTRTTMRTSRLTMGQKPKRASRSRGSGGLPESAA